MKSKIRKIVLEYHTYPDLSPEKTTQLKKYFIGKKLTSEFFNHPVLILNVLISNYRNPSHKNQDEGMGNILHLFVSEQDFEMLSSCNRMIGYQIYNLVKKYFAVTLINVRWHPIDVYNEEIISNPLSVKYLQ